MPASRVLTVTTMLCLAAGSTLAGEFGVRVPLRQAPSGNYYVAGSFNAAASAEFLVDTGASLVTINEELFEALERSGDVQRVRRMAARMADGSHKAMNVYRAEHFRIADCELGSIEFAVLSRRGRNILGLSALAKTAPFAVHLSPPALALSQCDGRGDLLVAN